MNQHTLQFMKMTQIAETYKKNAESYFNIKEKPENPTNPPPDSLRINYSFDSTFPKYPSIINRISNMTNLNVKSSTSTTQIANELKYLAKTTQNPKKLDEAVREFYNKHPKSVYPLVLSLCFKEDITVSSTLSSIPIDIKEIGPYFALSDEIIYNKVNSFNSPLLSMISQDMNNIYIQPPIFISNWKKDPPEQYSKEASQRYNYFVKLVSDVGSHPPKLTPAFDFYEYNKSDSDTEDNNSNLNDQKNANNKVDKNPKKPNQKSPSKKK